MDRDNVKSKKYSVKYSHKTGWSVGMRDHWARLTYNGLGCLGEKYLLLCYKRLYNRVSSGQSKAYWLITNVDEVYFSYLTENSAECEFSLDNLINQIGGDSRSDRSTTKARAIK